MKIETAKELGVYQLAYRLAMRIFEISATEHQELSAKNRSVGRMLGSMIKNPAPFLIPDR